MIYRMTNHSFDGTCHLYDLVADGKAVVASGLTAPQATEKFLEVGMDGDVIVDAIEVPVSYMAEAITALAWNLHVKDEISRTALMAILQKLHDVRVGKKEGDA
jgi:hypothetical protein